MATVNKDFKIKSGLVVEGTTGTINGSNILTESAASDQYIIDLIGGETLITSVESTQMEVNAGELNIKSGVFDAAGAADTAEDNAKSYADGLATNYDASGSAAAAIVTANSYTDGEITNALTTAQGYATTAEQNANSYTDGELTEYTKTVDLDSTVDGYGYLKSADLSGYATESYVGTAIDNLVDGAPGLLDTLNEIAAAINDDENYATTMTTALSGKQNTLTAGNNISIVSDEISVTGLDTDDVSEGTNLYFTNQRALDATSSAYDAAGSADAAEGAANTYTDNAINGLDTDDIEEGITNKYYSTSQAKTDAASLLTAATLTNITITGDGNGLTITAENGVGDSDTDDLAEGSTNLYFTEQRAIDALANTTTTAVQNLDITWVRREEAAYASVATASTATVHSFGTNEGSVKYLVRLYNNNKSHVTEVLATTDSDNNVAIVEYGTIYTSTNPLGTVTVEWNASTSKFDLNVTTANNGTEVLVAATLLAYND